MPKDLERRRRVAAALLWLAGAAIGVVFAPGLAKAGEPAGDWPNWRGPYSNGSVDEWPGGVVDHPDQARLLWTSEEQDLPGTDGPRWNGGVVTASGYSDVIVVKGRVYLNYCVANFSVVDQDLQKQLLQGKARIAEKAQFTEKEARYVASPKSDDVVICLDARTGRTLWKTVFANKGTNHHYLECRAGTNYGIRFYGHLGHNVPCYGNGRVYVVGSTGNFYALDAETGKLLWEGDLGLQHLQMEEWNAFVGDLSGLPNDSQLPPLPRKDIWRGDRYHQPFISSPTVADGVLLCHDSFSSTGSGLMGMIGVDGETGRRLWRIPDCLRDMAGGPVRWVHKGKEYVIAGCKTQALAVEPRTGRVLWTIPGKNQNMAWPAVTEDYLVLNGYGEGRFGALNKDKEAAPTCYRITPTEAKKVWELPFKECSEASPLIYKGWVIFSRTCCPTAQAFKLENGEEPTKVQLGCVYGPAAGDGFLFGGGDCDTAIIQKISPDSKTFQDVSPKANRKMFSHGGFLSPVYVGGRLYLRAATSIKCIDFRKTPDTEKAEPIPAKAAAQDGPGLVKQLTSPHYTDREEAVEALGKLAVPQRVVLLPELARIVQGESWQAARCAARILRTMGEAAKPAAPEVKRVWSDALAKKLSGNLELLSVTLATIAPDQAPDVALAVAKLLESDVFQDVSLGCHVLEELGAVGRHGVPSLTKVCANEDPERVKCAVRALAAMGPAAEQAVPALGELLQHPDREVIFNAARALAQMPGKTQPALAAILKARDYASGEYYLERAIMDMGAKAAAPDLCAALAKEIADNSVVDVRRKKTVLRITDRLDSLLRCLRTCGPEAKPAVPSLVAAIKVWPDLRSPAASEGLEIVLKIADNLGVEAKPMASVLSAWAKGNPRVNETLKKIGAEPIP